MSTDLNFTHKWVSKRPYQKTYKAKEAVEEVFQKFEDPNYNLADIANASGFPYRTIIYWHNRYVKDHSYRPGSLIGQHRRRFTQEEEENVACFIKTQYVNTGVPMHPKHLRSTLSDCWKSLDLEHRSDLNTSNYFAYTYLKGFCKRHKLSFRTMRKKKRSLISDEEVNDFYKKRDEVFKKYAKNRIGNMDETSWNFVYLRGKVLAIQGEEEVKAMLPADYRSCFTAIATILADGSKLPPVFLATGKTPECQRQFEGMESDTDSYELFHSPGKNTNDDTMLWYLHKFHQWMNGEPSALFLDRYTSHISDSTRQCAEELEIELVFIPTSGTDRYQPLDRYVFGVMKSAAAAICNDKMFSKDSAFTKPEAADVFVQQWDALRKSLILKAWESTDLEHRLEESDTDESDSSNDIRKRKGKNRRTDDPYKEYSGDDDSE